jgi:hypothetical protein
LFVRGEQDVSTKVAQKHKFFSNQKKKGSGKRFSLAKDCVFAICRAPSPYFHGIKIPQYFTSYSSPFILSDDQLNGTFCFRSFVFVQSKKQKIIQLRCRARPFAFFVFFRVFDFVSGQVGCSVVPAIIDCW